MNWHQNSLLKLQREEKGYLIFRKAEWKEAFTFHEVKHIINEDFIDLEMYRPDADIKVGDIFSRRSFCSGYALFMSIKIESFELTRVVDVLD